MTEHRRQILLAREAAQSLVDACSDSREGIVVVLGFGGGYLVDELDWKLPQGYCIVVYEADREALTEALGSRILEDLLKSPRVEILVGDGEQDFNFLSRYHQQLVNGNYHVIRHIPSIKRWEAKAKVFEELFLKNVPNRIVYIHPSVLGEIKDKLRERMTPL